MGGAGAPGYRTDSGAASGTGAPAGATAGAAFGAGAAAARPGAGAAAATPSGYQPTQRPERWDDGYASARPHRGTRDAPPAYSAAGRAAGRRQPAAFRTRAARPARTPRRRRRFGIGKLLIVLLVLILVGGVATVLWADSKLQRIEALTNYAGRPGSTRGDVTLIVGTDSREGLTPEQQAQLATGDASDAGGDRTDTMMLLYKPTDGGKPMIISIPRDLLVSIPEYGDYKINAAYGLGGPQLLVQVIEQQTGIRIDHYAEIGFGGFAAMVDDLGGVEMCLDNPIDDPDAGINLAAGCQNLTGPQALGFVRTRHTFAQQDLERVQNQRKFLSALMNKAASPGTVANPFKLLPFIDSTTSAMKVDKGDHIWSLAMVMWSIKSDPVTATVPFDGMADGAVGSYLVWGDTTNAFFDAIRQGKSPAPELYEQPPA